MSWTLKKKLLPFAFLDTKTTRQEGGSLTVSGYRKATNTDHYLDFKSHHHLQRKHSVICILMDCAKNIPSTKEELTREAKRVAKALTTNNYPALCQRIFQESRKSSSRLYKIKYKDWFCLLWSDITSTKIACERTHKGPATVVENSLLAMQSPYAPQSLNKFRECWNNWQVIDMATTTNSLSLAFFAR